MAVDIGLESPRECCGVFGAYSPSHENVAGLTSRGLLDLQHRGQESSGMVTYDGSKHHSFKDAGLVLSVFNDNRLEGLGGYVSVGHNRYSTRGSHLNKRNFQPIRVSRDSDSVYVAFNGNIPEDDTYRRVLEDEGFRFGTTTDTETIGNMYLRSWRRHRDEFKACEELMNELEGAYSVEILHNGRIVAFRDPLGVKPLWAGEIRTNGSTAYVLSSESCALNYPETVFGQEIMPGEAVIIDERGPRTRRLVKSERKGHCVFEYFYFSNPDSVFNGREVRSVRRRGGEILYELYHDRVAGSVQSPVPDSGRSSNIGYIQAMVEDWKRKLSDAHRFGDGRVFDETLQELQGWMFGEGLVKNTSILRTFIMPDDMKRQGATEIKYKVIKSVVDGRDVTVRDDSIVRGGTTTRIVEILRACGAKKVNVLSSFPPIRYPCYLGIDFPTSGELIASGRSVEGVKESVGADFLEYMTIDGLVEAVGLPRDQLCLGCMTGDYPLRVRPKERTRAEVKR